VKIVVDPLMVTPPGTATPPVSSRIVAWVAFVTTSLKMAVTVVLTDTPVAPLIGFMAVNLGGIASDACPVENVQVWAAAREFPVWSVTSVVTAAVYVVLEAKGADGVKIAVDPLVVTAPDMAIPPAASWKVSEVTFVTTSLKLTVMIALTDTPVAPLKGFMAVTAGGEVSGACPVENVQVWSAARKFPARSFTPEVPPEMVTVYVVAKPQLVAGVKVIVS